MPPAPMLPKDFVFRTVKLPNGVERKCVVSTPPGYDKDEGRRWPVVVFLHGSGECGDDGLRHLSVGLPSLIAEVPARFPFICLMPQIPTMWFRGDNAAAVWAAVEASHEEYRTDRERVYLTGLSMGGFGAWELAMIRPDVFAAVVPICGVGPKEFAGNILHLPVWAFHGAQDTQVPVQGSREIVAELLRLGAKPRYTEYADVGHTSWDRAYAAPELWKWLLAQRRQQAPRVIDYKFLGGSTVVWWLGVQAAQELKTPAHIRAEAREDGEVVVNSQGVAGWAIKCETYPLKIGNQIKVTWNDQAAFEGLFTGGFAIRPDHGTTQASSAPDR